MTGNEHFMEAERLLTVCKGAARGSEMDRACTAAAQVHATLALAWAFNRAQTDAHGLQQYMAGQILERREAAG